MSRFLRLTVCIAATLMLLCSCGRQVPDGAYRIELEESTNLSTSMMRKYVIEAESLRRIVLEDRSGSSTTTIAPYSMTDDRTVKAELVVEVELQEPGAEARVVVNIEVKTKSFTSRSDESLAVPGALNLSSILTESELTQDPSSETVLLLFSSDEGFLKVSIE